MKWGVKNNRKKIASGRSVEGAVWDLGVLAAVLMRAAVPAAPDVVAGAAPADVADALTAPAVTAPAVDVLADLTYIPNAAALADQT
jgi:hypothetical protein